MKMIHPITFEDINGQGKKQENYNFQEAASLLANYGFNCIRLTDDWGGADLLADHIEGFTLRIQLKGRITIAKKYIETNPYMLFPAKIKEKNKRYWFLIEHQKLLELFEKHKPDSFNSNSWKKENGTYHSNQPNKVMLEELITNKHLLGSVHVEPESEVQLTIPIYQS